MDLDDVLGILLLVFGAVAIYSFIAWLAIKMLVPQPIYVRPAQVKYIENGKGLESIERLPIPIQKN